LLSFAVRQTALRRMAEQNSSKQQQQQQQQQQDSGGSSCTDGVRCTVCPDDNNNNKDSSPSSPENQDEDDFVTLDLGPGADDNNNNNSKADDCDLDSLDAPTCAICMMPFEEGDRIGDLTCNHEFHVDCLKGWVQRKNACPLCNVKLGIPERPPLPANTASSNNGSSTHNNHNNNDNNNNNSEIDSSRHALGSLMARLNGNFRRGGSSGSSSNDGTATATMSTAAIVSARSSEGTVRVGSRIGIIGAVGAAEDIQQAAAGRTRGASMFGF